MTNHSHASGFFMSKCQALNQPDKNTQPFVFQHKNKNYRHTTFSQNEKMSQN